MIPFDEAIARLCVPARPLGRESIPLGYGAGRVLAEPVRAAIRAPASDVSTMDGYAVRSADLQHHPARLKVIGEARPGRLPSGQLEPGTCIRIFTGGALPAGADRVIIQEDVERDEGVAIVDGPIDSARYVRTGGSDFEVGDVLLSAGQVLTPGALVAAGAGDAAELTVWRRPSLVPLVTGDELVLPGEARARPGKVPDSITEGLVALARHWGAEATVPARVPDDLEHMRRSAAGCGVGADIIVVTGGASVGAHDHGRAMFGERLELIFSGVAIKPGKPVWLGRVGATVVLGLPGNPTSALVTARLFLAPLLAGLTGRAPADALRWREEPLAEPLGPTGDRETFSRAFLESGAIRLLPNQDSGAQAALARAELLVRRPAGEAGFTRGELVEVLDF